MIPRDVKEALERYVIEGTPTGSFLNAVLTGDLFEAFGRADINNRRALFDICAYIYNVLPKTCYGSQEAVNRHLQRCGDGEDMSELIAFYRRRQDDFSESENEEPVICAKCKFYFCQPDTDVHLCLASPVGKCPVDPITGKAKTNKIRWFRDCSFMNLDGECKKFVRLAE